MSGHLIDTNIFSEIFKANKVIKEFIDNLDSYIDTTVYIECLQGSKSNAEKAMIKHYLSSFPLLPYSNEVSSAAVELIDKYSNSHGLLLADALIASSAMNTDPDACYI